MRRIVSTSIVMPDLGELARVSAGLEVSSTGAAVAWAHERFGDGLVLASSFQDSVLVDIAAKAAPGVEVVFLDTQYHFAETLWYVEQVRRRYDLNLRVMRPEVEPDDLWKRDLEGCCAARKVEPLSRALEGKAAWITGLRRVDAPTRAKAPVVSWDAARGLVKINPLAAWTDEDMAGYAADHGLLEHPLASQGYPSIGCWPCTRAVAPGEDPRAGRWSGSGKVECGLHV